MQDLIERLAKATGPDRRLDFDLWSRMTKPGGFPSLSEPEETRTRWFECWKDSQGFPHYTSSIDAALTLVPEGYDWDLTNRRVALVCSDYNDDYAPVHWSQPELRVRQKHYTTAIGTVANPAIALCIAVLKARSV